jgi:hypothetical protein
VTIISLSGGNMFLLFIIGGEEISGKAVTDLAAVLLPSVATAVFCIMAK